MLQSPNQVRLNRAQQAIKKDFCPGLLHNKIIYEFIKICLPKFGTFNVPIA